MRRLKKGEVTALVAAGNSAENWQDILVADSFSVENIRGCRFEGRVEIEQGVYLANSTICNYHICTGARVESVLRLECQGQSCFGNGVKVATVNENGGRSVVIYDKLTAQTAYVAAMYRHRAAVVEAISAEALAYAEGKSSDMGLVGQRAVVVGAKFVRQTNVGKGATIEGASLVSNATLLDGAYVGVDVKATDFIAAQGSTIDCGAVVERCFVGENVVVSKGFTAVDSLIFGCSHLENGEACSIFAGPYTVSHHKSSLLIAGIFSFFNAGSGTNQSNHLFKSGAIHQAVHRRGCRFGSNGYVMAPSAEGEFTTVLGRHTRHHDTSAMPFSYLVEQGGVSVLLPAFALRSYGTVRDSEKWQARDNRRYCRDIISYQEYNPLLTGKVMEAVETLRVLIAKGGAEQAEYHYNNVVIKRSAALYGITMYEHYIAAAIGAMLSSGCDADSAMNRWVDLAGQYVDGSLVESLLDRFTTIANFEQSLRQFASQYDNAAHSWALTALSQQLGHTATAEQIAAAIAAGEQSHAFLRTKTTADRDADCGQTMSIGYGIDGDADTCLADFSAVQGV